MHFSVRFHSQGVGREHRRAKAKMDPTAHADIAPINDMFANVYFREVSVLLKRSPDEILLSAMVTIRRICATYSYYRQDELAILSIQGGWHDIRDSGIPGFLPLETT